MIPPMGSRLQLATWPLRQLWRLIIVIVGITVLLIGIAMIVLPGPAIVVIPIGLGLLGTEFAWARRLLSKAKAWATKGVHALASSKPK